MDLVASLDLGRISVCGHGLGAAIAVMLAAQHGALVHRIVLVSPAIYEPPNGMVQTMASLPVVGSLLFKQMLGKAIFKRHFAWKISDERLDELYEAFSDPAGRAAAHATLLAMRDPRPVVARVASARAPTLVIGGRDHAQFLAQGRRLAREIGARYEVLECGRAPQEECPEAFARTARAFLLEDGGKKRRNPRGRAA